MHKCLENLPIVEPKSRMEGQIMLHTGKHSQNAKIQVFSVVLSKPFLFLLFLFVFMPLILNFNRTGRTGAFRVPTWSGRIPKLSSAVVRSHLKITGSHNHISELVLLLLEIFENAILVKYTWGEKNLIGLIPVTGGSLGSPLTMGASASVWYSAVLGSASVRPIFSS